MQARIDPILAKYPLLTFHQERQEQTQDMMGSGEGVGLVEVQKRRHRAEGHPAHARGRHTLTPRNLRPPTTAVDFLRQTFVLLTREIYCGPYKGLLKPGIINRAIGPGHKLRDSLAKNKWKRRHLLSSVLFP